MAGALQQIPLDLGMRRALGRRDFQIGASNLAAVKLIDRWPDWPTPPYRAGRHIGRLIRGPASGLTCHFIRKSSRPTS